MYSDNTLPELLIQGLLSIHNGESSDFIRLHSDRTNKNIRHYFFNTP